MHAIGFLLMGLSGLGLVAGGGLALYGLRTGRPTLIKNVALFALGWAALYLIVLVSTSLASQETTLSLNERKAFCGFYLDCHLGVSVDGIEQATHIGEGTAAIQAEGIFYLITVRVNNDGVQAQLPLRNPQATLIDTHGTTYNRALDAERMLATTTGVPMAFARAVVAGDSYTKTIVFDVPRTIKSPKLLLTTGDSLERFLELFLIGDEHSLFHQKTVFTI